MAQGAPRSVPAEMERGASRTGSSEMEGGRNRRILCQSSRLQRHRRSPGQLLQRRAYAQTSRRKRSLRQQRRHRLPPGEFLVLRKMRSQVGSVNQENSQRLKKKDRFRRREGAPPLSSGSSRTGWGF